MVQFIQDFFLSPFLILLILIGVFFMLSWWSLQRHKEYTGYGLGWLIGVFAMVVYGALVGEPEPVTPTQENVEVTLNVLQVIFPSLIGITIGAWTMWMINQTRNKGVQKTILVALLTALSIWVIFLMIVSSYYPATQRMIGLFSLAFAIGAVTMYAVARQSPGQEAPSDNYPSGKPDVVDNNLRGGIPSAQVDDPNTGNRIRERIDRRR